MNAGGCLVNRPEAGNSETLSALYEESVRTAQ